MPKLKRGKRSVSDLTHEELVSLVNQIIIVDILGANHKITYPGIERMNILFKYELLDF